MHASGLVTRDEQRPDIRLLVPALAVWGVTAAVLPASGEAVAAVLAATATGGLLVWMRRARWTPAPVLALAAALTSLALVAVLGHRGIERAGPIPQLAQQGATVTAIATVTSDPRLVGSGAQGARTVLLRMTITDVTGRGARSTVATPVVVFADPTWSAVRWHDTVRVTGRLAEPQSGHDVAATLTVRGPPDVLAPPGPVDRAAEHVRGRFREAVAGLPDDARGLVPALVIGDTSQTPDDLSTAMRQTSLTHLSAVSGSNVTVVLAALLWVCGLVGVPRRARIAVALLGLAGFVVLARPEPSVIRAAVMGGVGLVAVSAHRERLGMPTLGAAVVVLLVVDPWLARSFGFALSALATLGLLLFARPWGRALERRLPRRLSGLGPALAIPLAAQVMCGPVTLLLQPGISVVGIPANLLAEPLVGPATMAGVVAALLSVVWVPLAHWCAWAAALPTLGIAQIARRGAQLPFGTAPWPEGPVGACALAALTLMLVLTGRRLAWWARARPLLTLVVAVMLLAATVPMSSTTWPASAWTIVACDVGQGDGLVLRTAERSAVLVDAGPEGSHVVDCLHRLGIERLDAVVLTHFHVDHVGGLDTVLTALPVTHLYVGIADDPPAEAARVARLAAEHHLPMTRLRAGDHLEIGTLHAEVLWPARVISAGSVPNNASVVLLANVEDTTALLCGDIERESAHVVATDLRRRGHENVDVLKVAHHGSSNTDPALVATAHAPLALVSVGKDNTYGHPAPSTLKLLQRAGARVVRTDECGDAAVVGHDATLAVACRGP